MTKHENLFTQYDRYSRCHRYAPWRVVANCSPIVALLTLPATYVSSFHSLPPDRCLLSGTIVASHSSSFTVETRENPHHKLYVPFGLVERAVVAFHMRCDRICARGCCAKWVHY